MATAMLVTKKDQIQLFHMKSQLSALGLERRGICFHGGSVCAHIKRTYGIVARKKDDVYRIFEAIIRVRENEEVT